MFSDTDILNNISILSILADSARRHKDTVTCSITSQSCLQHCVILSNKTLLCWFWTEVWLLINGFWIINEGIRKFKTKNHIFNAISYKNARFLGLCIFVMFKFMLGNWMSFFYDIISCVRCYTNITKNRAHAVS